MQTQSVKPGVEGMAMSTCAEVMSMVIEGANDLFSLDYSSSWC